MIRYAAVILIVPSCFYTLTFGLSMWRNHNKAGGAGAIILAFAAALIPIALLILMA